MQSKLERESELSFHPTTRTDICDEELEEIDHLDDEEDEEDVNDDFSFSFAAESAADGKFISVFPLFDQSLIELPQMPPVNKIFVKASAEEEAAGPYCAWSVDAAASSSCKKSNSTGFSKIWRFREMSSRSKSDGKDAFVFLNKPTSDKKGKDTATAPVVPKKKVGGKGKAAASSACASAHEVYVKSRAAAKEDDRKKSYLPYKPELVGFFTNVHGGMSKNVHPF